MIRSLAYDTRGWHTVGTENDSFPLFHTGFPPSSSAPVSSSCCPVHSPAPLPVPALPKPLPTGKLLELRKDRLEEVIVDLVGGTVVPNVEEVVH